MIFRLAPGTPADVVQELRDRLEKVGVRTRLSPETAQPIFAAVDKVPTKLGEEIAAHERVLETVTPRGAWRLADRAFRNTPTVADVGGVRVGGRQVVVIAGPCSVDAFMDEAADQVKRGADTFCVEAHTNHVPPLGPFKASVKKACAS